MRRSLLGVFLLVLPLAGCLRDAFPRDTRYGLEEIQISPNGLKVQVEHRDEDSTLVIHLSRKLSEEADFGLMMQFADLQGVQKASVTPYAVTLQKGELFSWNQILPPALAIIRTRLEGSNL